MNAALSEESVAELVNKGKVFILATLFMHSTGMCCAKGKTQHNEGELIGMLALLGEHGVVV